MKIKFCKDYHTYDRFWNTLEMNYAAMLVSSGFPVDRTGLNNIYDIEYDKIPEDHFTSLSFEECCMEAASKIWLLNRPVCLFWSGGIDSTAAAIALLETKGKDDVLSFICTNDSINEFPEFYEKIMDDCDVINILNKSIFSNHDIIKVTGECGDQLFGSDSMSDKQHLIRDEWHSTYKWDFSLLYPDQNKKVKGEFFEKNRNKFFEFLISHVDMCPFKIKTVFDLYWWINFTIKWENVNTRILFIRMNTNEWKSTIPFFNTDNFQRWSITNHDIKQKGSWKTYKQPAKDFIHKYFADENYRKNKLKVPSLIKVDIPQRYTPNLIKLCLSDGRTWRNNEKIDTDILNFLKINREEL